MKQSVSPVVVMVVIAAVVAAVVIFGMKSLGGGKSDKKIDMSKMPGAMQQPHRPGAFGGQ